MKEGEFFEKYGQDLKEVIEKFVKDKKSSVGNTIQNASNSMVLRAQEKDFELLQKAMIIKELIDLGCIKIGENKNENS